MTLLLGHLEISVHGLKAEFQTALLHVFGMQVVIPLEKVREVVPSVNENKQNEKYIQLVTTDGHEFWFMGFVNYDKGVMNMQDALRNIGVVDPQGGLKSRFGGNRNREVPQQTGSGQGYVTPSQENPAPSY